jgi:hypothetical protein
MFDGDYLRLRCINELLQLKSFVYGFTFHFGCGYLGHHVALRFLARVAISFTSGTWNYDFVHPQSLRS